MSDLQNTPKEQKEILLSFIEREADLWKESVGSERMIHMDAINEMLDSMVDLDLVDDYGE